MATKITYTPQNVGDPETVEWAGRTFKKGEAQEFDGRQSAHKGFIALAQNNPHFDVDGESEKQPPKKSGKPETAEEYRSYAIDWINRAKSSRELEGRWKNEEDLREHVGWGSDDQALIDPIYAPKLENMRKAEIGD